VCVCVCVTVCVYIVYVSRYLLQYVILMCCAGQLNSLITSFVVCIRPM